MKEIFQQGHSSAITFQEYASIGWSPEIFLKYIELCSQVRAAIISDACETDELAEEKLSLLLQWLRDILAENFTPEFDLAYALKCRSRYLEHNDFIDVGTIPYIYRSEEDFRKEIEDLLYIVCTRERIAETHFTPIYGTKSQALAALHSCETEKSILQNSLEYNLPIPCTEEKMYAWARRKAQILKEIESVDSSISSLLCRIEEFESGGEFDLQKSILYVYQGFIKCKRDVHPITCVTARIKGKDGKPLYLNVNYCKECKQFFISYAEYQHYRNIYGILIAKIVLISNGEFSYNTDYLALESPLKLCGYSVAQADGLSEQTRKNLLTEVVRSRVISKPEVMRYLSWFIQMNGQRYGNEAARKKWENDLAFVRDLDIQHQSIYDIEGVKAYTEHKGLGV